ncbi:MAG: endo-1,3-alpha-glucanase family glycosylhydrolase [Chitinophagaceae bacterium]
MYGISYKAGILAVVLVIVSGFHQWHKPVDSLKNRPQLSLPLTDRKLVIAHCMTNIIRYKGHKLEDSCNPEYYSPEGNISSPLGGLTQVKVMEDEYLANATLDEAVEFEMRSAMQSGIDGFQFYYTLGNDSWDEIIKAYFRVADREQIDFKFTFCISHPSGGTEATRIADFARRINSIMDEAGHDNPHWLRTPDGRLILYMWYGENLADIPDGHAEGSEPSYIANAYRKLGDAVHEDLACVLSINEQISKEKLNSFLDYFPAVWLWTLPYTDHYIGNMVAAECKKRNRVFTGSAFPDFYTSKLLKKGSWDMFHFAADAVKAGIENTERKYIVTGLSYNFRKQWEFAISQDVPLMNIITWNDYPEGHHLAPEINHNDGFSILLQQYKSSWKKETSPYEGKDVLIAFYKKYGHAVAPSPFNIPVVEIEKPGVPQAYEDAVDVVTILKEAADITVGGKTVRANAGLQLSRFPAAPGAVTVVLTRNNTVVETMVCPEWITGKPYRTDRLTYTFSNRSSLYYQQLFGDRAVIFSTEYNPGVAAKQIQ